ncbi:unnamed protein product [Ilex paraguariensis]|uniref:Uncharacterized protein n=1 Tax=Ilex paraguariensis TaxID=185542 RepID=A0ABC8TTD8_9AQUA
MGRTSQVATDGANNGEGGGHQVVTSCANIGEGGGSQVSSQSSQPVTDAHHNDASQVTLDNIFFLTKDKA